jgi:hypothetical protein
MNSASGKEKILKRVYDQNTRKLHCQRTHYSGNEVIEYVSFPRMRESTRSRNAGYPLEFTPAQAGAGMTQNTRKLS